MSVPVNPSESESDPLVVACEQLQKHIMEDPDIMEVNGSEEWDTLTGDPRTLSAILLVKMMDWIYTLLRREIYVLGCDQCHKFLWKLTGPRNFVNDILGMLECYVRALTSFESKKGSTKRKTLQTFFDKSELSVLEKHVKEKRLVENVQIGHSGERDGFAGYFLNSIIDLGTNHGPGIGFCEEHRERMLPVIHLANMAFAWKKALSEVRSNKRHIIGATTETTKMYEDICSKFTSEFKELSADRKKVYAASFSPTARGAGHARTSIDLDSSREFYWRLKDDINFDEVHKTGNWDALRESPATLTAIHLARIVSLLYAILYRDLATCEELLCRNIFGQQQQQIPLPTRTPGDIHELLRVLESHVGAFRKFDVDNGTVDAKEAERCLDEAEKKTIKGLVKSKKLVPSARNGFEGLYDWMAKPIERGELRFCPLHSGFVQEMINLAHAGFECKETLKGINQHQSVLGVEEYKDNCGKFESWIKGWRKLFGIDIDITISKRSGVKRALDRLRSGGKKPEGKEKETS